VNLLAGSAQLAQILQAGELADKSELK